MEQSTMRLEVNDLSTRQALDRRDRVTADNPVRLNAYCSSGGL